MTTFSLPSQINTISRFQSSSSAVLFNAALAGGQRRRFWAGLTGRRIALRTLPRVQGGCSAGLQTVKLDAIRGTEGRPGDFDDQFYPLSDKTRQRWQSVANAIEDGLTLPPVQLIQMGNEYFVRDGHHRVSVARALGLDTIEADVTVWSAN